MMMTEFGLSLSEDCAAIVTCEFVNLKAFVCARIVAVTGHCVNDAVVEHDIAAVDASEG